MSDKGMLYCACDASTARGIHKPFVREVISMGMYTNVLKWGQHLCWPSTPSCVKCSWLVPTRSIGCSAGVACGAFGSMGVTHVVVLSEPPPEQFMYDQRHIRKPDGCFKYKQRAGQPTGKHES